MKCQKGETVVNNCWPQRQTCITQNQGNRCSSQTQFTTAYRYSTQTQRTRTLCIYCLQESAVTSATLVPRALFLSFLLLSSLGLSSFYSTYAAAIRLSFKGNPAVLFLVVCLFFSFSSSSLPSTAVFTLVPFLLKLVQILLP